MTDKELKRVEEYARRIMVNAGDPQHSYDHVERVRQNALRIIKLLRIKDIDLNLLQAACLLHDVPISKFHQNPAIKHFLENLAVIKYLPGIIQALQINKKDGEILTYAIRRHTFTIPYKRLNRNGNIYLKIMQDADSIDFFSVKREESFIKNKNKFLTYSMILPIARKFIVYGRNNLSQYLNFPELSKYDWYNTGKSE